MPNKPRSTSLYRALEPGHFPPEFGVDSRLSDFYGQSNKGIQFIKTGKSELWIVNEPNLIKRKAERDRCRCAAHEAKMKNVHLAGTMQRRRGFDHGWTRIHTDLDWNWQPVVVHLSVRRLTLGKMPPLIRVHRCSSVAEKLELNRWLSRPDPVSPIDPFACGISNVENGSWFSNNSPHQGGL